MEPEPTDPYCQIIPGMTERLYPTIIADGSLSTPTSQDSGMLHKQITSELDKFHKFHKGVKPKITTLTDATGLPIHHLSKRRLSSSGKHF